MESCCCAPKPCPNCGYCPTCGRPAGWPYYQQPYNPWNPWYPYPTPGPVWIGYVPTTTGVMQSTPDCTVTYSSNC
jgi:hypothetical protein